MHRELWQLKKSKDFPPNQTSEQHAGTFNGDGVTGAPVIELEYKHCLRVPYLKRLIWRHINELGWYRENFVPKT